MSDKVQNIAKPKYPLFCPVWKESLVNLRLKRGTVIFTEIGREKSCASCGEFWPADSEFYLSDYKRSDGLSSWCKGCLLASKRKQREKSKLDGYSHAA